MLTVLRPGIRTFDAASGYCPVACVCVCVCVCVICASSALVPLKSCKNSALLSPAAPLFLLTIRCVYGLDLLTVYSVFHSVLCIVHGSVLIIMPHFTLAHIWGTWCSSWHCATISPWSSLQHYPRTCLRHSMPPSCMSSVLVLFAHSFTHARGTLPHLPETACSSPSLFLWHPTHTCLGLLVVSVLSMMCALGPHHSCHTLLAQVWDFWQPIQYCSSYPQWFTALTGHQVLWVGSSVVCVGMYMCGFVCVCLCLCVSLLVWVGACILAWMCVHLCLYAYTCVYVCMWVWVWVCMHTRVHACATCVYANSIARMLVHAGVVAMFLSAAARELTYPFSFALEVLMFLLAGSMAWLRVLAGSHTAPQVQPWLA